MIGIQVTVPADSAIDSVRSLRAGLTLERVNPLAGRAARNVIRSHFFGINGQRPNALGGPRTNFWTSAGRATQFRVVGDAVIVSVNQVGVALRHFGGTVRPRVRKYLTIPAIPEAHGKRASEFSGLSFSIERHPKFDVLMPALVQGARSSIGFRKTRQGGVRVRALGTTERRVVYWLVKQTKHQPDETMLPRAEQIQSAALRAIDDYAKLLWERRTPPPLGGDS